MFLSGNAMTRAEKMAAIVGLTCMFASEAYTEDCSFLRLDPLLLTDRQVYFEAVSGQPWQLLTQPPTNLPSGDVKLAYVFRESFREGHGGVIVAKSGRTRSYYEPQVSNRDKKIALYRGAGNYCSGTSTFDGRVSAKSYDDYHDLGQGGDETATIVAFHAGYIGRRKYCRGTDENVADGDSLRTNRGQFSFDTQVVSRGTYSQVAEKLSVRTALASSEKYFDQRVEIKQYDTQAAAPTCVRISLPAQTKPGAFVRLNDLEGLTFDRKQARYTRSNETEWKLTPAQ
jgi:hypothetical protein